MTALDKEEQEILAAYEADELEPARDSEAVLRRHREYAEAASKKDQRITIRISSRDLELLRVRALQEGLPYQTLIASVLHKYVAGRLVDRREGAPPGEAP